MLNDTLILLKESLKSKISDNFFARRNHLAVPLAQKIAKKVKAGRIEKIIDGKPYYYIIVTNNMIIRVAMDSLTEARYLLNKNILKKLAHTKIADFVPRFIEEGSFEDCRYFCENRLKGNGLDVPISKMNEMVLKAADFITDFHQQTAQKVILDRINYKRLFSRFFDRLNDYLEPEYKKKLSLIEERIKNQILGKPFVTVWHHGDYKIENVLFDTADWSMKGVIDWDLSEQNGLPLLDIFYLLLYKANLMNKAGIANIFKTRFLMKNFLSQEKRIIDDYLKALNLNPEFIDPLLKVFWVHHIALRYQNRLIDRKISDKEWFKENVYSVIDAILNLKT